MFTSAPGGADGAVPFTTADYFVYMQTMAAPSPSHWNVSVAARMPGTAPRRSVLCELLADVADRIPALRYRIAGTGWRMRFEYCARFDVSDHIDEVRAVAGQSAQQCLLEATERLLPFERPPWGIQIVSGYTAGEYMLVYRVAHLLQDGVAAARTAQALFTGAAMPEPLSRKTQQRMHYRSRSLYTALRDLRRLRMPRARGMPKLRPSERQQGWLLETVDLDRAAFDAISRHTGASTAHISLAVLAGALRAWAPHHAHGFSSRARGRGLPVYLPVSLRQPRDRNCLGNQLGIVPLLLPCHESSPVKRLHTITRAADRTDMNQFRDALSSLQRLPRFIRWLLARGYSAAFQPYLGVSVMPSPTDAQHTGALEVLTLPVRPSITPGICLIVPQPSKVAVTMVFAPHVTDTARLPSLLTAALAELRQDSIPPARHDACHGSTPVEASG